MTVGQRGRTTGDNGVEELANEPRKKEGGGQVKHKTSKKERKETEAKKKK